MTPDDILVVSCAHPVEGSEELARALVEARLAACVQISSPMRSHYRWKGALESAEEVRLDVKTAAHRLDALVAAIRERHPYEVPEIVATPLARVDAPYAAWVRAETT